MGWDIKEATGLFYDGAKSFAHFQDALRRRLFGRCVSQMFDNLLSRPLNAAGVHNFEMQF